MAMNIGNDSGEGEIMVEMNTTPLIDVMLVLLTLLIITLPIQTHAVKLDMPPPHPKPPLTPPTVHVVGVDFDGTPLVDGQAVNMAQLDAYMYDWGKQPLSDQPEIHLDPNRLAKYDTVAKVLADAQRRGVAKIGFVNMAQYGS
jgi:biopolymer transport protein ExbD